MKSKLGVGAIITAVAILAIVLTFVAFKTFGPPSAETVVMTPEQRAKATEDQERYKAGPPPGMGSGMTPEQKAEMDRMKAGPGPH